ncbi:unnamed protein product [Lactuca virosa]|uniref:Uncharacterized protein n=1 Tax=Lactuca virosa TaxID=75947 RepID=A0AAU9PIH0_9ASTR|nr:unnamed protein product [Lactuca virosa]
MVLQLDQCGRCLLEKLYLHCKSEVITALSNSLLLPRNKPNHLSSGLVVSLHQFRVFLLPDRTKTLSVKNIYNYK